MTISRSIRRKSCFSVRTNLGWWRRRAQGVPSVCRRPRICGHVRHCADHDGIERILRREGCNDEEMHYRRYEADHYDDYCSQRCVQNQNRS